MSTPDNQVLKDLIQTVSTKIADLYASGSKDDQLAPSFVAGLEKLKVVAEKSLGYLQTPKTSWLSFSTSADRKEQRAVEIQEAIQRVRNELSAVQHERPVHTYKV